MLAPSHLQLLAVVRVLLTLTLFGLALADGHKWLP
jgi:hypothetical protein